MALQGTLNSSKYNGRYLQFSWTATQSITGNYSDISWTLKGAGDSTESGVKYYKSGNFKVTIAGTKVYSSSSRIDLYNGTKVTEGTTRIYHNDTTGAASFAVAIEGAIYYTAVNCTGSTTFTLDAIPRHPNMPTITSPTTGVIGEKSTSISVKWSTTNRGTYTLEVSKNGGAYTVIQSDIAIGTLSYNYSITPSQGDTYVFRVKAVYNGLSSSYSTSGTVTINKLEPPTIGNLNTFNPYVNSTYTVPLSGGSQSNGGVFIRRADIHVDGNYKYEGTYPSANGNTSVNITVNPSSIAADLGDKSYSSATRFTIVAWCENSNGSRSSYVRKTFEVNINTDGGATPSVSAPTISGGMFGYTSTCFVAGASTLTVNVGSISARRAPSGTSWNYKIEVTGYSSAGTSPKTYENLTAGIKTITVTATDSRGLSTSVSTQIRVQAYAPPTIKNISGSRLANPNTSAQVVYDLAYTPIYAYNSNVNTQGTQLNGINSQQYSVNDTGTWSNYSSGSTIANLDVSSTHTIHLRVTDKVKTSNYVSASALIPTIIVPFTIRRSGVGIKCIPQSGYALDVNGAARFGTSNDSVVISGGKITTTNNVTINGHLYATNAPLAWTVGEDGEVTTLASLQNYKNFMGSAYQSTSKTWYNAISVRHRNGVSDGSNYGMYIASQMQKTDSSLIWNQQSGGSWGVDRTILDSSNYTQFTSGMIRQYRRTFNMQGAAGTTGWQQDFQLETGDTVIGVNCFETSGSGYITYTNAYSSKSNVFTVWFYCLNTVNCEMTCDVFVVKKVNTVQ